MPAIAPSYLNCVLYFYPSRAAAEDGTAAGGSGFILAVPSPDGMRAWLYAVTNRHIVNSGNHTIRYQNSAYATKIIDTDPADWIVSTDDDLAIVDFNPGEPVGFIATDVFLPESADIDGWPLFPGDNVMFFGRFIGHDGRLRNRPVLRFGNIAMLADDDTPIRVGEADQVAYLVECRSLSGFSGSPALVHLSQPRVMGSEDRQGFIPSSIKFLGVNCAHLPAWTGVRERRDAPNRLPNMWVETNSGMAVVIPAWRLMALVNSERLLGIREAALAALEQAQETESSDSSRTS